MLIGRSPGASTIYLWGGTQGWLDFCCCMVRVHSIGWWCCAGPVSPEAPPGNTICSSYCIIHFHFTSFRPFLDFFLFQSPSFPAVSPFRGYRWTNWRRNWLPLALSGCVHSFVPVNPLTGGLLVILMRLWPPYVFSIAVQLDDLSIEWK